MPTIYNIVYKKIVISIVLTATIAMSFFLIMQNAHAEMLTAEEEQQITATLGILSVFGFDQSVIDAIEVILRGDSSPHTVPDYPHAQGSSVCPYKFVENLSRGSYDSEVKKIQQFLNEKGFTVSTSGDGSPGRETMSYGPKTEAAIKRFQDAYKIAVTGVWNRYTREKATDICVGTNPIPLETEELESDGSNPVISGLVDGEWEFGESKLIKWDRNGVDSKLVDIFVCESNPGWCSREVGGTINDGSHYIEIDKETFTRSEANMNSRLRVRVIEVDPDSSALEQGNNFSDEFNMMLTESDRPTIKNFPSNRKWEMGDTYNVEWNRDGISSAFVDIKLCREIAGCSILVEREWNDGSQSITMPEFESGDSYGSIFLVPHGAGIGDYSTELFEIVE